jgi:hypothetical protein
VLEVVPGWKEPEMLTRVTALACVVAAAAFTATADAGHAVSKQRIAITTAVGDGHAFVLAPLTAGPVARDSGTASACCWTPRFVTRAGQSSEIDNPLKTYVGKRGTFTMRLVIDWIDAGNRYTIGTGTWKIVSGTGAYEHLEGNGRIAVSWPDALPSWQSSQAQGLVDLRRVSSR